jgi:hypothetical protein
MAKRSLFEKSLAVTGRRRAAFIRKLHRLGPAERKEILLSAGIITPAGKLTAHYR